MKVSTPYHLIEGWLSPTETQSLWLSTQALPWQVEYITMYGKKNRVPRKIIWIADEHIHYRYSNQDHAPEPWPNILSELRSRLNKDIGCDFNGVLGNLYEDGHDYMGWHSDDEASINNETPIASISLGASRKFKFRSKLNHSEQHSLELNTGSLLIMPAGSQEDWQHTLPKMLKVSQPRINLTFRVMR